MADEIDNDEQDDLDDEQDDSDDEQERIPTAPWFITEEINVSSDNCSNINPFNNDLVEDQNFADKQTAMSNVYFPNVPMFLEINVSSESNSL